MGKMNFRQKGWMEMNEWMEHPDLANLDPLKQELIRTAAMKAGGKNGKALAPVMMSLITGANKRGIRFTPEEISLILSVIKEGKSPQEQAQIDQMVQMIRTMQNRQIPPESSRR